MTGTTSPSGLQDNIELVRHEPETNAGRVVLLELVCRTCGTAWLYAENGPREVPAIEQAQAHKCGTGRGKNTRGITTKQPTLF